MNIRQTCLYMVMGSGILLFAGCYILADRPQGEAQLDSTTLETRSKSLAGSYRDIGSDGSIKPHPQPSYRMNQETQTGTEGSITLGGPVDMPNMRTGTIKREMPRSSSGLNNTGSPGGTSGAGGK